ncbi:MAG: hydroxyacylglutathione hydrolase [Clostridiales bacterium]|jgi:glyoxylase-like metal-dependent hydrolase (beta-lactamase superfamily II)|nr:hydroxyacylglutathione hydrolase [Clostridiales bacterium]MDN5299032.1 hydroxyacylglutathione hydrolase [Clostridiales bacterium]
MDQYRFNEIKPNFYSIEMGMVRSFLFVGETEMLLIDLGIGGSALKEQVKKIADLPMKVLFTHADRDHVGDAADFETRYMYPGEIDYYENSAENPVDMEAVWEGDVIEIGDYRLEVIHLPGHTPGSIALLESGKRFLIGGDTVQKGPIFMFGKGRNFNALIASMKKLKRYTDNIDVIYACHFDLENPVSTIDAVQKGAEMMLAGQLKGVPEARFDHKVSRYDAAGVSFFAL